MSQFMTPRLLQGSRGTLRAACWLSTASLSQNPRPFKVCTTWGIPCPLCTTGNPCKQTVLLTCSIALLDNIPLAQSGLAGQAPLTSLAANESTTSHCPGSRKRVVQRACRSLSRRAWTSGPHRSCWRASRAPAAPSAASSGRRASQLSRRTCSFRCAGACALAAFSHSISLRTNRNEFFLPLHLILLGRRVFVLSMNN